MLLQCHRGDLSDAWCTTFSTLRDLVLVAWCDGDCSALAAHIVECFAFRSPLRETMIRERAFVGVLRLVFPPEGVCKPLVLPVSTSPPECSHVPGLCSGEYDGRCQAEVMELLRKFVDEGQGFRLALSEVLDTLQVEEGPLLEILERVRA